MIFGLIKDGGVWRSKCAFELCTLYKDPKLMAEVQKLVEKGKWEHQNKDGRMKLMGMQLG